MSRIRPGRVSRRSFTVRRDMRARTFPRTALFALVVLLLLGACGPSGPAGDRGSRDRPAGPRDSVPMNPVVRGFVAEISVLNAQMDKAVAACMASKGFPFFAESAGAHFDTLIRNLSIRFGLSLRDAKGNGYGPERVSSRSAEERYFQGLSRHEQDAYALAHLGTEDDLVPYSSRSGARSSYPVGGCIRPAAQQVFGGTGRYVMAMGLFDDLQYLNAAVLARANEDETVRKALNDWSDCMAVEGYSFETPGDARDKALETSASTTRNGSVVPRPKEIAIAIADARCQAAVFLSEIFVRAAVEVQRPLIAKNSWLFVEWDELLRQVASVGYPSVRKESRDLIFGSAAERLN